MPFVNSLHYRFTRKMENSFSRLSNISAYSSYLVDEEQPDDKSLSIGLYRFNLKYSALVDQALAIGPLSERVSEQNKRLTLLVNRAA